MRSPIVWMPSWVMHLLERTERSRSEIGIASAAACSGPPSEGMSGSVASGRSGSSGAMTSSRRMPSRSPLELRMSLISCRLVSPKFL